MQDECSHRNHPDCFDATTPQVSKGVIELFWLPKLRDDHGIVVIIDGDEQGTG